MILVLGVWVSFAKTPSGGQAVDLSALIQKQFRPMVTTLLNHSLI